MTSRPCPCGKQRGKYHGYYTAACRTVEPSERYTGQKREGAMPETIASAPSNGHAPPAPMPEPLRELPSRSRGWEYAAQRVSMSVPGITVDVYLSNAGRVEIEVKRAGVVVHEYRR